MMRLAAVALLGLLCVTGCHGQPSQEDVAKAKALEFAKRVEDVERITAKYEAEAQVNNAKSADRLKKIMESN